MRCFLLAGFALAAAAEFENVEMWMLQAFYPALLGILVIASLGIPIPEDIPLIAAGVLLRTHPGCASWTGTILVALLGIMTGDLVLYTLGKRWGPGVVNHRSVRWMISPARFEWLSERFHRYGAWFCFFGRFFMGIRAAMCLTAGATRFPYWRFFLADFAGALLSVPFFVVLGYLFAGMIPTLRAYLGGAQALLLVGLLVGGIIALAVYKYRKAQRKMESEGGTPACFLEPEMPPVRQAADDPQRPAPRVPPKPAKVGAGGASE